MKRSMFTIGNFSSTSSASSDHGPDTLQVCVKAMWPTVSHDHAGRRHCLQGCRAAAAGMKASSSAAAAAGDRRGIIAAAGASIGGLILSGDGGAATLPWLRSRVAMASGQAC